tara:strand:- start:185 stop:304 length:120 start_codon:yes stop_codon:yes gene_type:complete
MDVRETRPHGGICFGNICFGICFGIGGSICSSPCTRNAF